MKFFEKKKLTKLVLAWMLCAGGGTLVAPQAEAATLITAAHQDPGSRTVDAGTNDTSGENSTISADSYFYGNWGFNVNPGSSGYYSDALHVNHHYMISPFLSGVASGYSVSMTSGTLAELYGGYTTGSQDASNNKVTISGGTVGSVYGGSSESGNASNNKVNITGGTIKGNMIVGGHSNSGDSASDNVVTLGEGVTLDGNVWVKGGNAPSGKAENNTVNILAALTFDGLEGGEGSSLANSTGNTLNIAAKNVKTGNLNFFQNMNFYLPAGISSGDTMLTVTGAATDLKGVTFGAAALKGVSLKTGDTVNLITNANGLDTDSTLKTKKLTTAPTATSLTVDTSYDLSISKKGNTTIIATVDKASQTNKSERTKSLVETRAAGATFLNAGSDLIASGGFAQAADAIAQAAATTGKDAAGGSVLSGFTPFASIGGSGMRAESGSHVDTRGVGMLVGVAKEFGNKQGTLLFGPFVEYGGGDYDSYLDDGTHADGGTHCWGGGVMARQVNYDGLYFEASLRGGKVKSDFNSNIDGIGKVNYDSSSTYLAGHLGLGKVFDIGHNNTLDGYLKYFYTRQGSDDVTIHAEGLENQSGHFDSVNSSRLRVGARLTHKLNDTNTIYGGLAYQYEFDGEARATFNGTSAPSPSIKGSSGVMELGWKVKPNKAKDLTLDLGVTGWAGKQRGIVGQLSATWKF